MTNTEPKIGGVPYDAPLFRGASLDNLLLIIELLSSASFHYADDSGGEWSAGRADLLEAAQLCYECELSYDAIQTIYRHKHQLVSFSQLMDRVLVIGYAKG